MTTGLDTDVLQALATALSEEKPCEAYGHGKGLDTHDEGDATWYLQMKCTDCGMETEVQAVCEWYKDSCVLQNGDLYCPECNDMNKSCDFLVLEKIK